MMIFCVQPLIQGKQVRQWMKSISLIGATPLTTPLHWNEIYELCLPEQSYFKPKRLLGQVANRLTHIYIYIYIYIYIIYIYIYIYIYIPRKTKCMQCWTTAVHAIIWTRRNPQPEILWRLRLQSLANPDLSTNKENVLIAANWALH